MPDFPNTEIGLKKLRVETFEVRQKALAANDQATAQQAQSLIGQIDAALDNLAMEELARLTARLAELTAQLGQGNGAQASHGETSTHVDLPSEPPVPILDTPDLPVDGPAGTFVSARKIAEKTILYIDAEGREILRIGGSRSWRCCNAGNIRKGDFSNLQGAIGDDGAFAIFPSEAAGRDAIVKLLQTNAYQALSIKDAIFRYAPPSENDSAAYAGYVETETGLPGNTPMQTLNVTQLRKMAKVIQKVEGWKPGEERPNKPLSQTNGPVAGGISSAAGAAQDWMSVAKTEAARPLNDRSEWADPGENPLILNYFKVAAPWFSVDGGDEVDWCAAFANYCLLTAGYGGTNHPGARSFYWNKSGYFVRLAEPAYGAVAVRRYAPFDDKDWKEGNGHVGFVVSHTATTVTLLGGNQGNTVQERTFPRRETNSAGKVTSEFVAFMMPVIN